jgi:nucleotide-binding universal stress UspA family protein
MAIPETKTDFSLRNILVPTDFSTCSYEALLYTLNIARRYKSKVTLLHVLPPQHPSRQQTRDEPGTTFSMPRGVI